MAKKEGRLKPARRRRKAARPSGDLRTMAAGKLSQLFNTLTTGKRAAAIGRAQRAGEELTQAQKRHLAKARAINKEIGRRQAQDIADLGRVGRGQGRFVRR